MRNIKREKSIEKVLSSLAYPLPAVIAEQLEDWIAEIVEKAYDAGYDDGYEDGEIDATENYEPIDRSEAL